MKHAFYTQHPGMSTGIILTSVPLNGSCEPLLRVATRNIPDDWVFASLLPVPGGIHLLNGLYDAKCDGLFDLDRKIRPVDESYKKNLIRQWRDILPTESFSLTLRY